MTSIGRGRGWASAQNKETALRRPGRPASPINPEFTEIITEIDNLVLDAPVSIQTIKHITKLVSDIASKENLKSLFDILYKQALEDKLFGIKLTILFSDETFVKISDSKNIRNYLLNVLQVDYYRKEEIKEANTRQFHNLVSFFGETYFRLEVANAPLRVLKAPFIDYLEMLLESGNDEDVELIATQIINNVKSLQYPKEEAVEFQQFMLSIRKALITQNFSATSRALLLLSIEVGSQQAPMSKELREFYESELGTEIFARMIRYDVSSKKDRRPRKNSTNTKVDPIAPSETTDVDKSGLNEKFEKLYKSNNVRGVAGKSNNVPRAIRGSGAAGIERERKSHPKSQDGVPSVKQDSNNRAWQHDDRFNKDYD